MKVLIYNHYDQTQDLLEGGLDEVTSKLVAKFPRLDTFENLTEMLEELNHSQFMEATVLPEVFKAEQDLVGDIAEDASLAKGLGTALALVGAMALGGGGQSASAAEQAPTEQAPQNPQPAKWTPAGLHPHLVPIAHLETRFGRDLNHKPSPKGDYDTAFGAVGLKPMTAHEEFLRSKVLQDRYGDLKDPARFTQTLKEDPQFYNLVASQHFMRLVKQHGSTARAAYAWRYGTNAAAGATEDEVESAPYVQKYHVLSLAAGLTKMAMKDIKPGPRIHSADGMTRHDYSHFLKPEHQADYSLHVEHWAEAPDSLYASLVDKKTGTKVGRIDAGVGRTDEGKRALETTTSTLNPDLRGKGMGRAMYEALLSHGYFLMGLKHVVGGDHSSMAHRVHESIASKHGFPGYDPDKIGREKGENDNAYVFYEYKLR